MAVGLVAIVMAVWLVLGIRDSLVGLPEYLAPTTPLPGIYAALARSGDLPGVVIEPVVWLLFWSAVLGVYLGLLWPAGTRRRARVVSMPLMSVVGIGLFILGGMGWFHWWSAFGMGNSVSDELPPGVGGTTPFGVVTVLGGAAVGVLGGLLWAVGGLISAARARAARSEGGSNRPAPPPS